MYHNRKKIALFIEPTEEKTIKKGHDNDDYKHKPLLAEEKKTFVNCRNIDSRLLFNLIILRS